MLEQLRQEVEAAPADPYGLRAAMLEWLTLALSAGYHQGEWAQKAGNSDPYKPAKNKYGDTQAFTSRDFMFKPNEKQEVPSEQAIHQKATNYEAINTCW
jgi:hypothetical protein